MEKEAEKKTSTTVSTGKQEPSSLAYVIAIITLGAAFGNMFLAGKMRNIMKAQIPKAAYNWKPGSNQGSKVHNEQNGQFNQSYTNASQSHNEQNFNKNNRNQQQQQKSENRSNENEHDPFAHYQFFDSRSEHLQVLGLDKSQFSESNIKAAYRKMVMKYHPDRIALDDPKRDEYVRKFQQISASYNILMDLTTKKK